MSIKKKDLLKDIQEKIDLCNEHISLNPYLPALRRVGYVMNNSCKTTDVPFYLNAVYNQQQMYLNTDVKTRNKFLYSAEKEFKLSDIDHFGEMYLNKYEYQKITYQYQVVREENYSVRKKGLFKDTIEQKQRFVYDWVNVIDHYEELVIKGTKEGEEDIVVVNAIPKKDEMTNSSTTQCSSLGELIREYALYKNNVKNIDDEITYLGNDEHGRLRRQRRSYTYDINGNVNIRDYVNSVINQIKSQELKEKLINREDDNYNWEFCGWEFYMNGELKANYHLGDVNWDGEDIPLFDGNISIDSIIDSLAATKKANSKAEKLQKLHEKLLAFYKKFDELFTQKYFDPYYEAWSEYKKKYGYSKEPSNKKTKAFKEVKILVDKMFDVVLEHINELIVNSSLASFVAKYQNFEEKYVVNQNRPEIVETVDTLDYKKLQALMKLKQAVLKLGNAKLKEYYDNQEMKLREDLGNHVIQLQKDLKEIEQKEQLFTSLLDALNLRYNGLQTAFKELIAAILNDNKKKMNDIETQYDEDLFKLSDSDMNFKVVVKFRPDSIPQYYWSTVVASSFVYEDLETKLKEMVQKENEKKLNTRYLNTTGKELYLKNIEQLKTIELERKSEQTILQNLEKSYPMQELNRLYQYRDEEQSQFSKLQFAQLEQQICDTETQYRGLLDEIENTKKKIGQLDNQYYSTSQQCYYYEAAMEDPINQKSLKYDVYSKKEYTQKQLLILNVTLQEKEAIRRNQAIINKSIIDTNSSYMLLKSTMSSYYDNKNKMEYYALSIDQEKYYEFKKWVDDYLKNNAYKFLQLKQYQKDMEHLQFEYFYNAETLKNSNELKKQQKEMLKQLAEIEQQIALLESDEITLNVGINLNGDPYLAGYTFSRDGLYQNLYIDTQMINEWLVLRLKLKELYNYYNLLDDEILEPKNLIEVPLKDDDGNIIFTTDENKDGTCNWFLPMDYEIFGVDLLPFKLALTTKVYVTDNQGNRIMEEVEKDGKKVKLWKTLRRLMAVQDGYGFIDTGKRITLYYTGVPGPEVISVFIPGVGLDYGALLAGNYIAVTPLNVYLMQKYPYGNDKPDGQFYWLQTGILRDAYLTIRGKLPIEVTFKIYKKFPLACGYPKKCGELTDELRDIRGVCGLKKFFELIHDLNTLFNEDSFSASEYFKLIVEAGTDSFKGIAKKATSKVLNTIGLKTREVDAVTEKARKIYKANNGEIGDRAAQMLDQKRKIALWGNSSYTLACNTWNIVDQMDTIKAVKNNSVSMTQQVLGMMGDLLLNLIPPLCQHVICLTYKGAQQDSIKELGSNVLNTTITTLETLNNFVEKSATDVYDSLKDSGAKIIDGVENAADTIYESAKSFIKNFDFWSLTQYCPRRLKDITKDINPYNQIDLLTGNFFPEGINIFDQLNLIFCLLILGNIMGALNSCITRSITTNSINYSNLFPEGTRKYLEAVNSVGDIADMARELEGGYGMTLENLFHEANRSSILLNFVGVNTDDISLGYLYDFLHLREIDEVLDIDRTLNSDQVIDNLKNTISRAVTNNEQTISKLKDGAILSMNDQYKNIVNGNLVDKTKQWALDISSKINAGTGIGLNVKGLMETDFSQGWNNPNQVTNKLNNISKTMSNLLLKMILEKEKEKKELDEAFAQSLEFKLIKEYAKGRYLYLESLTNQDYSKQENELSNI